MNSKQKGEVTEAVILARLAILGKIILLPFGNNQRYDIVIEKDGKFIKGQCKTAVFRNGCIKFSAHSTNGFTGTKKGYKGEVDVFWVYCPEINKTYEISVDEVGVHDVSLRVNEPIGKARYAKIKWAKNYEL